MTERNKKTEFVLNMPNLNNGIRSGTEGNVAKGLAKALNKEGVEIDDRVVVHEGALTKEQRNREEIRKAKDAPPRECEAKNTAWKKPAKKAIEEGVEGRKRALDPDAANSPTVLEQIKADAKALKQLVDGSKTVDDCTEAVGQVFEWTRLTPRPLER